MYGEGLGVEKSEEKALEYFKIAADRGHEVALYNVGKSYTKGLGVEMDTPMAIKYLSLSITKIQL